MFMKAFMPATNDVPFAGIAKTSGFTPYLGHPAPGWSSIAAKIVASRTEIKVKNADAAASFARVLNVRGKELTHDTTATMALKPTVQSPWLLIVLRYFDPVRQWKP